MRWPEQYDRQDDIVRWAQDTENRLSKVGVTPAAHVEFGEPHPSESVVRATTATSVLPTAPPDCATKPGAEYPGEAAHSAIYAWLSLTSGEPKNELVQHWQPEAVALADQVRQLLADQQHASLLVHAPHNWVHETLAAGHRPYARLLEGHRDSPRIPGHHLWQQPLRDLPSVSGPGPSAGHGRHPG
ncbi:DUF7224 domain-containing protein [Streptomyces sp. NBC_01210]|uniref:DUF7224 domain-containing protein n=1 Tax=Streptomyces sp. NBC_01210 TaxID=2903774 RepID=UPI003FA35A5F